jgi:2-phospho-L-lactate guanylyltransferase
VSRPGAAPPALVRLVVLVPVRALEGAKARLGEALDAEERRALVERLLARTVRAAAEVPGVVAVGVVSPDPEALALATSLGAVPLAQERGGLNDGLHDALDLANDRQADAVLVVPADLPAVDAAALVAIVDAARQARGEPVDPDGPAAVVALVTDRAGVGTNALLVAPPGAIPYRFGDLSRQAHADWARRAGAAYVEVGGPLDLDLDTPDDLLAAEARGLGALAAEAP